MLLAPSMQPPARFPWRKGGCCTGVVGRHCDLIHLHPMVSISLFLRDYRYHVVAVAGVFIVVLRWFLEGFGS